MSRIVIFGAAGKMGTRISATLNRAPGYELMYVESGAEGMERLRSAGLVPSSPAQALADADAVVLAIPDVVIGKEAAQIVPALKPGAMVVTLDPAAAYAGELPERAEITYFVTHPCHPSLANKDLPREALEDYFGGVAPQALMCARCRARGDYAHGEALCRDMFAPVSAVHRITVEQMALLELPWRKPSP